MTISLSVSSCAVTQLCALAIASATRGADPETQIDGGNT